MNNNPVHVIFFCVWCVYIINERKILIYLLSAPRQLTYIHVMQRYWRREQDPYKEFDFLQNWMSLSLTLMSIFACLSILQMSIDSLSLLVVANMLVQLYTFFSLLMFTKCLWSINLSSYGQIILKIWKTIGYTIYLLYYNGYLRRFHNICWWSCCMVNSRSPLCKPTLEN